MTVAVCQIRPTASAAAVLCALPAFLPAAYFEHLSWFLFGVVAQAAAASRRQVIWATLLTVFNVTFNLLPVLQQRQLRARASRLTTRTRRAVL